MNIAKLPFRLAKKWTRWARLPRDLRRVALTEGMTTIGEARLLYELAREVKSGCILEVGSYRGRSTVALALGAMRGAGTAVYALEPHEHFVGVNGREFGPEDRAAFFRAMLHSSCYQVVRLVNLSSEVVAAGWQTPIGLLWIDGDHSYHAVKRDLECWEPHLLEDGLVALDDSVNPDLGPAQVIAELTAELGFEVAKRVEKITVLRRTSSSSPNGPA